MTGLIIIVAGTPLVVLWVYEVPKPGVHLGYRALLFLLLVNRKLDLNITSL